MLFALLHGCNGNKDSGGIADGGVSPSPETQTPLDPSAPAEPPRSPWSPGESDHVHGVDFVAAFRTFPPDTVMITAGGFTATWAELFFNIYGNINSLISSFGELPDLTMELQHGITYADAIMEVAVEHILQAKSFEYGARLHGIELSDEEQALLEITIQEMAEPLGGEDALLERLWTSNGITNLDLFKYLFFIDFLPMSLFVNQFGEWGDGLSDEEVAAFTENDGYIMAKHILIMKQDGDDAPRERIEDILHQLKEFSDDDFENFFDLLMFEFSEDQGGVALFPGGYLFQPGDFEESFYEAVTALEIGELSGVVETSHGYHIILRLPINYDVAPVVHASRGDEMSLRMIAAFEMFEMELQMWRDSLNPVFSAEFESIDLSAIFVSCSH